MLELVKHPNSILNLKLDDFNFESSQYDPKDLEKSMIEIMVKENGRGLAASQVGINARVFVIKTEKLSGVFTPFAIFNPFILVQNQEQEQDYEGCLSFPNLFLPVKRSTRITVQFLDRDKKDHIIELEGIDARCFLHEYDHLNGICFIEGMSKLKLDLAIKRQRKLNGRTK